MSILVVDDSSDSRLLLKSILESAEYTDVLTAGSAQEAFHCLGMDDPAPDDVKIDLILIDFLMPGVDGVEACRQIKAVERLRDIPIIMITAATDPEHLKSAFAAGATDYLTKPSNQVELLARVLSGLRLKNEMDARKAREQELLEVTRQLEATNQALLHLASFDGLTGVANRRRFDEFVMQEWRRAARDTKPMSLILLDIDFFEAYNDTYGHQAGDDCLKRVAEALNGAIRRPGDMVARYGGEEFVAVLPGTHSEGAALLAETLRARVEALGIAHAASWAGDRVTISVGVATTAPDRDSSPAPLIAAADRALYQAKHEGRNRVVIADVIEKGP